MPGLLDLINARAQNAATKMGYAQDLMAQGPAGNPQAFNPVPEPQTPAQPMPPQMTVQQAQDRVSPPLGQSVSAGWEQTKGMVKNAIAGAAATVGQDAYSERWRNDASKHNQRAGELMQAAGAPTTIADVNDFGDFGSYMAHAVARGLPQIAAMGVGAALTRGRGPIGQTLGAAVPSAAMNYGDTYGQGMDTVDQMVQSGQLDPAHAQTARQRVLANAAVAAPIMGILDATGFSTIFKTGLARKEFAHALADGFLSHAKKAILTEGGTEAVQQYVQNAAVKLAVEHPEAFGIEKEDAIQMFDAFLQGGAMGGAMAPVGHLGGPIGAVARGVEKGVYKGIEALRPGERLQQAKDAVSAKMQDMKGGGDESYMTKAGRVSARVFDGDIGAVRETASALMEKASELPGVQSLIQGGKDYFTAFGKSERLHRAADMYKQYEPEVEKAFGSFMERMKATGQAFAQGWDENADLSTYKDLYNKYRDLFLRTVPTDVNEAKLAKGMGEKAAAWADGIGDFIAGSEERIAAFAKGAYEGTDLAGWKKFGGKIVEDLGDVVTPEAMQAAGQTTAQTVSAAGDVATAAHDVAKAGVNMAAEGVGKVADALTSDKAKQAYAKVGEKALDTAEAASQHIADAYQGFLDGIISADEAIKPVTDDLAPDSHPLSASEASRTAKAMTDAVKQGTEGKKLSVLGGSRDRPLFEAFIKSQAPNLPKSDLPRTAAALEYLINNPANFQRLASDIDQWSTKLFNLPGQDLYSRLQKLVQKEDVAAPDTAMKQAMLEAARQKEFEAGLAPTEEVVEPDQNDVEQSGNALPVGVNETEGLNQTGVNNPFMDEATFQDMLHKRDKKGRDQGGTQSQVQVTRTRYDADGNPTGEAVTTGHTVNLINIARSYSRRRRLKDDKGVYGRARQDRNFQEGLGALLNGWRNELPDGGYEEVTVQPARGAGNVLGSTPQETLTPTRDTENETSKQFAARKDRDTWSGVRNKSVIGYNNKTGEQTFGSMRSWTSASNAAQSVMGFLRSMTKLREDYDLHGEMTATQRADFEEEANNRARRAANSVLSPFYDRAQDIFDARKDGISSYEQAAMVAELKDTVQATQAFLESNDIIEPVDRLWRFMDGVVLPPETKETIMSRLEEAVRHDDPTILEGEALPEQEFASLRREVNAAQNRLGDQWKRANEKVVGAILQNVYAEISQEQYEGVPLSFLILPSRLRERAHNELASKLRDFESGRLEDAMRTEGEESVDNPDPRLPKEGVATEDASGEFLDYTERPPSPPVSAKQRVAVEDAIITKRQLVPQVLDKMRSAYKAAKTATGKKMLVDAARVLAEKNEQVSLKTLQTIMKKGVKPVEIGQLITHGMEDPNMPVAPVKTPQTKLAREKALQADSMMGPGTDYVDQEARYSDGNAPPNYLRHRGERGYPATPPVQQTAEMPVTDIKRTDTKPVGDTSSGIADAKADARGWKESIDFWTKELAERRSGKNPNMSVIEAIERSLDVFRKRLAETNDRITRLTKGELLLQPTEQAPAPATAAPEVAAQGPKARAVPSGRRGKKFSRMSQEVHQNVGAQGIPVAHDDPTGGQIYKQIAKKLGGDREASDALQEAGIPGHYYNSHGKSNSQHPNYVMFDDSPDRVDINAVEFSKYKGPFGTIDLTTKEGQDRARAEIRKIAGELEIRFAKPGTDEHAELEGAAGSYDPEGHIITLAVNHYGGLGTAAHEALHAVFKAIDPHDRRELMLTLKHNAAVRQRLMDLLKDFPEAQKAMLNDPEEAAAYAFQFWKAGALDLKPQSAHLFQKIEQLIHRVWQWMRGQASAHEIFQRISDGLYANGKDYAAEVLARQASTRSGIQKVVNKATQEMEKLHDRLLTSMDDRLRETGISAINDVARHLYVRVGEQAAERGLAQAIPAMTKKWMNEFQQILGDDHEKAHQTMTDMAYGRTPADPEMAQQLRRLIDKLYVYQRGAGVGMEKLADYMPLQWSGDKISDNQPAFVELMQKHQADIDALNKKLKAKMGKHFRPLTPEKIAEMMANRNLKHAIPTGDVYDEMGAPTAWHTLDRVFKFLSNEERAPFVEDDLAGTMATYIKQSVRRAEYVRRFKEDSSGLTSLLERAKKEGASEQQLQLVRDSIDNIFNVRFAHMDPDVRHALGMVQTYQNFRVLGLSLLSSVIDPLVLGVRTQDMGEAWKAYKHAIANIIPKGDKSALERFSEDIGAVERFGVADAITDLYGAYDTDGWVKKLNDKLFTYNGMNGLTRALRVFAVGAGQRFIDKHAKAGDAGTRMLAELGLSVGDVHYRADGQLALTYEDFKALGLNNPQARQATKKIQDAINRFVDESVLHPNAMERPNWGSDPLWGLVFHLKQYMFSFQKIVGHKIWHEAEQTGSMKPFLTAVPFIPIMGASQFVRELIQTGGAIPADHGVLHYMLKGLDRSGFQGPEDIPMDITADLVRGRNPLSGNVVGPTADQLIGLLQAPTKGGYRALVEALPGQSVFGQYLISD